MPDLRSHLLRIAQELPQGNPTRREILAAVVKQAGPKVTRSQEGFIVEGGDWPEFIIDQITKGPYFPASQPPDKVGGTALYVVKLRSPDALCLSKGDIQMSWRSASLIGNAERAVFDPMGRSLEDFTALFGRRSKVSVKGGRYEVQYAAPAGRSNPVEGLVQVTIGPGSMFQKIPLADLKRDGVLEDAPIQIGGAKVGTVLVPKGLAPELGDLRGLFK